MSDEPIVLIETDFGIDTLDITQRNQNIQQRARVRWRESQQTMQRLLSDAPGIRQLIRERVRQRWALDSENAGLLFSSGQNMSLTQACAQVVQQPVLPADIDDTSAVYGVPQGHALHGLSPLQLLEALKELRLQDHLMNDWMGYWHTRAPGTPISRYDHAQEQYRLHFRAACEHAFAQGSLDATHLGVLLALLEPVQPGVAQTRARSLTLVRSATLQPRLDGALVIARDGETEGEQLLYLPAHQPALQRFASEEELKRWVSARLHQFWPRLGNELRPTYSLVTHAITSIDVAFQHMMEELRSRMFQAALSTPQPAPAMEHATPLAVADQLDIWRQNGAFFSLAPPSDDPDLSEHAPAPRCDSFDSLHEDVPLEIRLDDVKRQREALEALVGDLNTPDGTPVQVLLDALRAASRKSDDAAAALFDREHLYELRTQSQTRQEALLQARMAALQAEVKIQRLLDQLDDDDQALLQAVLDAPRAADRNGNAIAASITLQRCETDRPQQEYALSGAVVFCHAGQSGEPDRQRPVLLYLPGTGGGLMRFASVEALQQRFFKVSHADTALRILLTPIEGDPFSYGLQRQLLDCEQAALKLQQQYPEASQAPQRRQALDELRRQTLLALQIVVPPSRELAWSQLLEQHQTLAQLTGRPDWLGRLTTDERLHLGDLLRAYIKAARRFQTLMDRDLPARERYAERQVNSRLREQFALTSDVTVTLDLPDAFSYEKEVIAGSGAPGTPSKLVIKPSAARSQVKLSRVALDNITEDMRARLHFMQAAYSGGEAADRETLGAALDSKAIQRFVTDLDLAGRYETRIREALLGTPGAATFELEQRDECVLEPIRLMLQIHAMVARQTFFTPAGETLLRIALDARSAEAFRAEGHDIRLLPADLTAGGPDTNDRGTTLSGVTFVQDATSGITLLYLPDSPDGKCLRQYENLEQARMALYRLAFNEPMEKWLANRALAGDPEAHRSRIRAACIAHHDRIIGVGPAWPVTTSLAMHLRNAHMGRLIMAHRSTSLSKRDLHLEDAALASGMVFNHIKMALGLVPVVGTAVALYDAWVSANAATAAFLQGTPGQGVDHLETLFQCLIDAGMDLLPGLGGTPLSARQLTRQRQSRLVGDRLPKPGLGRPKRTALDRFEGYECLEDLDLSDLTPAVHGIYQNVYRHASGDLIINHGQLYRVEFDSARHTWRLIGKGRNAYRQPIALDATGNWDTHGVLYGVNVLGPLGGGGNALGLLADIADPLWPAAIRQRLPNWWTNRALRRQLTLRSSVNEQNAALAQFNIRTNEVQQRFNSLTDDTQRRTLWSELTPRFARERELAGKLYSDAQELGQLSSGNNRTRLRELQSRLAWLQVDRLCNELQYTRMIAVDQLDSIEALVARTRSTPVTEVSRHVQLMQARKLARIRLVEHLDSVGRLTDDIDTWNARITAQSQRSQARQRVEHVRGSFPPGTLDVLKAGQYLEIINRYETADDLPWFYLQRQIVRERVRVNQALDDQTHLPEILANPAQRRRVLESCVQVYQDYRRKLLAWNASYPDYLDQNHVQPLLDTLQRLSDLAEQWQQRLPTEAPLLHRNRRNTPQTRRLFETEDNQLLTGIEGETGEIRRNISVDGLGERADIYVKGESGRWRLQAGADPVAPAPAVDYARLAAEAEARLKSVAAYTEKVQGYARQNMLPVDLEHLMLSEASELRIRADRIAEGQPQSSQVTRLREKAATLLESGRQLRIRQTLASETPSEAMLDYLLQVEAVEAIRLGRPVELPKRPDGRRDFLQEYEIRDLTQGIARPLWYAHFHYGSAQPVFDNFVKAHLKTAAQRRLGLQWQQAQGDNAERIWRGDIGKPLARKHFQTLFES